MSRRSYGSPRVHAELRLGQERPLLAASGSSGSCDRRASRGIHRRRRRGCTRRDPTAEPSDDLVNRAFDPAEPDRLWVMDVTEHPTARARSTWPSSSTPSAGGWWAGRSPITSAPSSSSTPCRWPSGAGVHRLATPSPTRITGRPTRRGRSGGACAVRGCSAPWDRRRLLRQLRGRELLRHPAARAARRAPLGRAASSSPGAIFEWIEAWYNPQAPAQLLQDAQSRRLRSRSRGMISN